MILYAWILSGFCSLPQVFVFSQMEVVEGSGIRDCWASFHGTWGSRLYVSWFALSIYIVPLLILSVTYGQVTESSHQSNIFRTFHQNENSIFVKVTNMYSYYHQISQTNWVCLKLEVCNQIYHISENAVSFQECSNCCSGFVKLFVDVLSSSISIYI